MKRPLYVFTIFIAVFITTNLFASVTVKNMDSARYELVLNCNQLVTPMFVNANNTFQFNMQGSECDLTLVKTRERINVRDKDVLIIRNLNLFKK